MYSLCASLHACFAVPRFFSSSDPPLTISPFQTWVGGVGEPRFWQQKLNPTAPQPLILLLPLDKRPVWCWLGSGDGSGQRFSPQKQGDEWALLSTSAWLRAGGICRGCVWGCEFTLSCLETRGTCSAFYLTKEGGIC